jgi:hypothetical protein
MYKVSEEELIMTRFVKVNQLARNNRFQSGECFLTKSLCTQYLLRTVTACITTNVTLTATTCGTIVKLRPACVSL